MGWSLAVWAVPRSGCSPSRRRAGGRSRYGPRRQWVSVRDIHRSRPFSNSTARSSWRVRGVLHASSLQVNWIAAPPVARAATRREAITDRDRRGCSRSSPVTVGLPARGFESESRGQDRRGAKHRRLSHAPPSVLAVSHAGPPRSTRPPSESSPRPPHANKRVRTRASAHDGSGSPARSPPSTPRRRQEARRSRLAGLDQLALADFLEPWRVRSPPAPDAPCCTGAAATRCSTPCASTRPRSSLPGSPPGCTSSPTCRTGRRSCTRPRARPGGPAAPADHRGPPGAPSSATPTLDERALDEGVRILAEALQPSAQGPTPPTRSTL